MLSSLHYSARNLKYQVSLPEARIHAWGEGPLLMPRTRPIWGSGWPTGEAQPTGTCMQSLSTQLASSERSTSYCALYYLLLPNLLTLRLPVGPPPWSPSWFKGGPREAEKEDFTGFHSRLLMLQNQNMQNIYLCKIL